MRGRAEGGGGVWEVGEGELRRPAVVAGAAEATASEGGGGEGMRNGEGGWGGREGNTGEARRTSNSSE